MKAVEAIRRPCAHERALAADQELLERQRALGIALKVVHRIRNARDYHAIIAVDRDRVVLADRKFGEAIAEISQPQ
ncbi:hypothetical protein D3C72_1234710 [compost metagenome]